MSLSKEKVLPRNEGGFFRDKKQNNADAISTIPARLSSAHCGLPTATKPGASELASSRTPRKHKKVILRLFSGLEQKSCAQRY